MSVFGIFGWHPFTTAGNAVLRVIVSWVQRGAASAIREVANIISVTTTPQLTSTWFSSYYWRVAGLATLLTVPFLFAAALQAMVRSDLALLGRAAFGYLPLALIGVGIASPITMLLLSATDQMSAAVSGLAVGGGAHFLTQMAAGFVTQSDPFYAVLAELIAVGAALTLSIELLVRAAAVYIVVLMLPLAFAALVWPARRIWVVRLLELLVALIVSKFVIVAVLSLAGAAYGHSGLGGMSRVLLAMSLLLLAAFAPWTLLRLLPFTELGAAAAGALSQGVRAPVQSASRAALGAHSKLADDDPPALAATAAIPAMPTVAPEEVAAGTVVARMRTEGHPASRGEADLGVLGGSSSTPAADPGLSASPDPETPGAAPEPGATGERIPGLGRAFQQPNLSWDPLVLGPDLSGGPLAYDDEPEPDAAPETDS